MMWNGYGMSGWGFTVMMLSQLLFWALLIGGGIYLARTFTTRSTTASSGSTPEQILAQRYARGEIDDVEYQQRLKTLERR